MLPQLNLPVFEHRIKHESGRKLIFDRIRKKYVALTPEEWVRQNFVHFLIENKKYPEQLTKIEAALLVNKMKRRCDIVVYNRQLNPYLIVECKAPEVKITQKVFDQIAAYNWELKAKYLVVTNGINHFFCQPDYCTGKYAFLRKMPEFEENTTNPEKKIRR